MNLFLNYYVDPNVKRNEELIKCLYNNLFNDQIDRVYILCSFRDFTTHEKTVWVGCDGRPTFRDYFNTINRFTGPNDINVIINSDIFLREPIIAPAHDECFALTRWDILPDGTEKFYNNTGSQDTWVFRGPIRMVDGADFTQGVAGCDNRIAYLLKAAGYKVSNPSLTIKTYHLHNSGVRNYDKKKFAAKNGKRDIYRVPGPRISLPITEL